MSSQPKEISVLVVDDDDVDQMAIKRCFADQKILNPLVFAKDGKEALDVLHGKGSKSIKAPYLVLLDLNMPRMSGLEFLVQIRKDANLKKTVVFVLTTSNDERDIEACHEFNVAGYLVKSNVGEQFVNAVGLIEHYWKVVEFPD